MSVYGYTPAAIVEAYSLVIPVGYTYAAAITMVVYDSLILFQQELECIYTGRQTLIKWIYVLIKLTGLTTLVLNFVAYMTPPQTPTLYVSSCYPISTRVEELSRCLFRQWFANFLFEIVDTAVIKTLLVLRLRSLYHNNRNITVLLWLLTAVELLSATYAYVLTGLDFQQSIVAPAPIPGCPINSRYLIKHFRPTTVIWAVRFITNGFELILLLYALRRCLKETESRLRAGLSRLSHVAPTLFVFYRDGTIFYIPLCALSMFGLVATVTDLTLKFTCSNWEVWLSITYYIVGTRLVLNIRQAGVKFSASMVTGHKLTSLVFPTSSKKMEEDATVTLDSH